MSGVLVEKDRNGDILLNVNIGQPPTPYSCIDADGNKYSSVRIGEQQWLVENLKTTKYADGTPIPNITNDALWAADTTGAYCYYNNDIANKTPYGALYNWYAVNNAHGLAPTGWRVPSKTDLDTLVAFLGGFTIAGGKLKEIGLSHWITPNTGATNDYGFTALPDGARNNIMFYGKGTYSTLWSSTAINATTAYLRNMVNNTVILSDVGSVKYTGYGVRCMRNI